MSTRSRIGIQPGDDSNWREEYKGMKVLNSRQIELLENGPDSLAASWSMQAMKIDWKKMKGYKDPEPPDCQSSFNQWSESLPDWDDWTA